MQWQHSYYTEPDISRFHEGLDASGKNGWELVSVVIDSKDRDGRSIPAYTAFFKKRLD